MNSHPDDISPIGIDSKLLTQLIVELNIARRNSRAYPKGHPLIAASLAKALHVYEELLNSNVNPVIGVTSDALMVDGKIIEKSNIVFRDFSRALFERSIGAILFHKNLMVDELQKFIIILGLKREQINQLGGIEEVWTKAGIAAITIRPIRYDLFETASDPQSVSKDNDDGEGLWDKFARELTRDELSFEDSSTICLDPEIVAEILNNRFLLGNITNREIRKLNTDILERYEIDSAPGFISGQPYQKLADFFSKLTPELRRQFLESSFGTDIQNRQTAAEKLFSNLSDNAILETLDDINNDMLTVSPAIFGLLQRLGENIKSPEHASEEDLAELDLSEKMRTILLEHASEEFVPDDYQKKLNHIVSSERISTLNMEEVNDLLITLDNRTIENSIGHILMDFIRQGVETPEERELLLQNFSDMFAFFLQTGDYGQLQSMIDQLSDNTFPAELKERLRDVYYRREFFEEILDGLSIWGKPRYGDVRSLIQTIGGQFIEAILDRLAEEKNMSIRRFYMDCLTELGSETKEHVISRLTDKRWYFLRNLLIILAGQNDPSVVPLIRPLLRNKDNRLRHEVLKTLVHFKDHQAEKQLLEDLGSKSPEQLMAAIQLAEKCSAPAIASKLTELLAAGGFAQMEYERKSAIVHALGEIGKPEVLPELAKLLGSRSLFHSHQLSKLKTEIVRSLPKYPAHVSKPVLEHIAVGSSDIAKLATEMLGIMSGKN